MRAENAEKRADIAEASLQSLKYVEAELEMWKHQISGQAVAHSRPHLIPLAQEALRCLVPEGHPPECRQMQQAVVTAVEQVSNVSLWKKYMLTRKEFIEALQHRRECPWATNFGQGPAKLASIFEYVNLDCRANEVLLLHGTSMENAEHIVTQGFDERMTQRKLYGPGVYLTSDACKAAQYCGKGRQGCIIIARVLLGHPFEARGPMPSHDRPPAVEGRGVLHDSVVACPGIPNGKGKGKGKGQGSQLHWEFVVSRGDLQIYPELRVYFTRA